MRAPIEPGPKGDYTIDQDWGNYTPAEHTMWDRLYARQMDVLPGRAARAFLEGLDKLDLNRGGIPDFRTVSEELRALSGWEVVAVAGLVPDEVFFDHLANRRFPAGNFIRTPEQIDYIQEPDVFHDVFGHVPMLCDPDFADYMEAYGRGGLRAMEMGALKNLAALYWYTVEFGLVKSADGDGLRIYGAGIVSSPSESVFALEDPSPHRIPFDLERVMATDYRIDDFQESYFVIDDYSQLVDVTVNTDFGPVYERLQGGFRHKPGDFTGEGARGTGAYAAAGGRLAEA